MKMRKPHIITLSRQAIECFKQLRELTGFGEHILPSFHAVKMRDNYVSDVALLTALRRMGYSKDEMTVHGFRGMASTLLNERGYRPDIIELQLAHVPGGVRAAYNHARYMEERRTMMQEYADYLDELRDGEDGRSKTPHLSLHQKAAM
jgi:integrase